MPPLLLLTCTHSLGLERLPEARLQHLPSVEASARAAARRHVDRCRPGRVRLRARPVLKVVVRQHGLHQRCRHHQYHKAKMPETAEAEAESMTAGPDSQRRAGPPEHELLFETGGLGRGSLTGEGGCLQGRREQDSSSKRPREKKTDRQAGRQRVKQQPRRGQRLKGWASGEGARSLIEHPAKETFQLSCGENKAGGVS